MDFCFTPAQQELRDEASAFVSAELAGGSFSPVLQGWLTGFDRGLSRRLAERGWIGLTWPTEHGGAGRTYVDRLVVNEVLLAAGAPLAAHWMADRQMAPSILAHGTDDQKARYLPEIRTADVTYCIGMSEPQAGSDLSAVATRAERTPGGWRVIGHKTWTSLAQHAEYMYALVRTEPGSARHQGLSEMIIPLRSAGVTVTPIRDMSGGHHFNEVFLDGVRVDDGALIGTEGQGWRQITGQLGFERAGLERVMSVWPLLDAMRADVGVATNPRRLEELGELEAAARVARLLVFRAAAVADTGHPPDTEAAVAKLVGTDVEQAIVEVASRWAGRTGRLIHSDPGASYGGHLLEAWLAAPSFSIRGGTNEVLTGIVARRGLGL